VRIANKAPPVECIYYPHDGRRHGRGGRDGYGSGHRRFKRRMDMRSEKGTSTGHEGDDDLVELVRLTTVRLGRARPTYQPDTEQPKKRLKPPTPEMSSKAERNERYLIIDLHQLRRPSKHQPHVCPGTGQASASGSTAVERAPASVSICDTAKVVDSGRRFGIPCPSGS
jgi:hypothetical protein